MRIYINRVHYPVLALGPGTRLGIWVQGCTIGCEGCMSKDTWSRSSGSQIMVSELVDSCRAAISGALDGVTISGGEPFEQPAALDELIEEIRRWDADLQDPLDILVYSGFTKARLERLHPELLASVDGVVAGPYVAHRAAREGWRGSSNQELLISSRLGRLRYPPWTQTAARRRTIQATVASGTLTIIGIPGPDDLEQLARRCHERGLTLTHQAWQ